jgi:hypothetical protein
MSQQIENVNYFAHILIDRINGVIKEGGRAIKGNYDNFIIVDSGGNKGKGKTVFSVQLSKAICKIIGFPYSRKELMVLDPTSEKIKERVKNLPKGCPIHIDEAILIAYLRDFQKEDLKDLIKFINLCRKHKKIIIFNTPDFWTIDKGLRNMADYRVICIVRGLAHVNCKWVNPETEDKWLRRENEEKISKFVKNVAEVSGVISGIRQCLNHLYDIKYNDLDEREYADYEEESLAREMQSYEVQAMPIWKLRFLFLITKLLKYHVKPDIITVLINEGIAEYCKGWKKETTGLIINPQTIRDWKREFEPVLYGGFADVKLKYNNIEEVLNKSLSKVENP